VAPLTSFYADEGPEMSDKFTGKAKAIWDAIPPQAQERILNNVWCVHCSKGTTITDFKGSVEKGDLILTGQCVTCGGKVARLIESE
jgi:hypothetical protein